MSDIKSWTGERLETFVYNENTNEHLHRYALAMQLIAGKRVLDIACGEGYGAHLMATVAKSVVGVDIDTKTIVDAAVKYQKENLFFLVGSADKIPCEEHSFDVVVSFETIEHHDKHDEMMQEIKRVLKPGGLLMMSSPDKMYYSDIHNFKNPYHVKELYKHEFDALLKNYFKKTFLYGQKSFFGSMIVSYCGNATANTMAVYRGNYNGMDQHPMEAVYVIALASDADLPAFNVSVLDGADVLKRQFEEFRIAVTKEVVTVISDELRSSWSFRIGHFILSPVRLIKTLFHA